MRILHLTTFLQGGAGRVIADLALAQRLAGHEPSIVTSRTGAPGYGNYDAYVEELTASGIPVDLVDSMFSRDTAANLAVVRFLDARYPSGDAPDVIHTHAATPSLVALVFAAARRQHITLVQTMHGWGVMKTPHQAATDVALLNLVDRVVVPSRQSAATIAALGVDRSRTVVVPYGVSHRRQTLDGHDLAAAEAMEQARARGALVVACVGTIGRRKNQALLVDALERVQDQVQTHCLFVGDGDVDGLRIATAATRRCGEISVRGVQPERAWPGRPRGLARPAVDERRAADRGPRGVLRSHAGRGERHSGVGRAGRPRRHRPALRRRRSTIACEHARSRRTAVGHRAQ